MKRSYSTDLTDIEWGYLEPHVPAPSRRGHCPHSTRRPRFAVGAEADPEVEWEVWRGWRVPGVKVPGVRFYAMRGRRDKTLVIRLKDETYERFITEVDDPGEVAESINEAVGALTTHT